jgi:hypothetical protein
MTGLPSLMARSAVPLKLEKHSTQSASMAILATTNPTRGISSLECHSTLAATRLAFLLQRGPAFEACEKAFDLGPRRAANRSAQHMIDMLPQDVVGSQANGIDISCIFQCLIKFRIYIGCIRPKEPHNRPLCMSHDHWLQERFPAFTAMHVFRSQSTGVQNPKWIEDKIGVIARTSKGTVPCTILLAAVGWAN